jgi:hypothetical protein
MLLLLHVEVFADMFVLVLQWRDNWEYLQVTGDYQRVLYYTLEGVQELAGSL